MTGQLGVKARLFLIVLIHHFVVIGNTIGFFCLAFWGFADLFGWVSPVYWAVALATCSFIFTVSFTREPCQLSRWENALRRSLGKPEIKGFIKYYYLRPWKET